jgi:hypothetical protein
MEYLRNTKYKMYIIGGLCMLALSACSSHEDTTSNNTTPNLIVTATPNTTPELKVDEPNEISELGLEVLEPPEEVDYSFDDKYYKTPWVPGYATQKIIDFGCTDAPYYKPDPNCPDSQGNHHGIDLYYPCGTKIILPLGITAIRLDPNQVPNSPKSAYGEDPLRIRLAMPNDKNINTDVADVVIGHSTGDEEIIYGVPYQSTEEKQLILAEVGEDGAPDGCHLHFEVRDIDGAVTTAIDPSDILMLENVS